MMIRSKTNYTPIINFGCSNAESNSPLSYCLGSNIDQKFLHGSSAAMINGQSSRACQLYLSEYCANGFDQYCEFAAKNNNVSFPNNMDGLGLGDVACKGLTQGEVLIHNTARRKYLQSMGSCVRKFEPFDPNVANSPLISYWTKGGACGGMSCAGGCAVGTSCVPSYAVNPETIDNDRVMDLLLQKPYIAIDILINIFNTMKRQGTLDLLRNTKLGRYYAMNPYFRSRYC